MPDNQQNPYGAQPFGGPFADAITPQVVSQPHESKTQFTGGSKTQALTGLLSKFLEGYGKGQMQKSMATEVQKTQQLQGYTNWADRVMSNPDIPQEQKKQFATEFTQAQ